MSALGHKQIFTPSLGHVRFAPESGHPSAQSACAKSGLMQRSKKYRYSITSSARSWNSRLIVSPSLCAEIDERGQLCPIAIDEVTNALSWRLGRSNSAILPKAGKSETQKIAGKAVVLYVKFENWRMEQHQTIEQAGSPRVVAFCSSASSRRSACNRNVVHIFDSSVTAFSLLSYEAPPPAA